MKRQLKFRSRSRVRRAEIVTKNISETFESSNRFRCVEGHITKSL